MLSWIRTTYAGTTEPLQAKQLQKAISDAFGVTTSSTTVRHLLRRGLGMTYKQIYRGEIRANTVRAKQKRQMASVLYVKVLAAGKALGARSILTVYRQARRQHRREHAGPDWLHPSWMGSGKQADLLEADVPSVQVQHHRSSKCRRESSLSNLL